MKNVLWKINSRYAVVSCFEKNGSLWVEKIITPHGDKDALWINEVSLFFRTQLLKRDVPLCAPYLFDIRDNFSIQTSIYAGEDVEKLIKKDISKKEKISLIEKIILSVRGILLSKNALLEVGVDALLPNFCLNDNGEIHYIDTFPPLVKYRGEYIVHFPNPAEEKIIKSELFRKFNSMGILRRLRFSILENSEIIEEADVLFAAKNVLGNDFYLKLQEYFLGLPHNSNVESIESIQKLDTDSIREIALKKAKDIVLGNRREFLENIFELSSSFCPLKISSDERVNRLMKMLVL